MYKVGCAALCLAAASAGAGAPLPLPQRAPLRPARLDRPAPRCFHVAHPHPRPSSSHPRWPPPSRRPSSRPSAPTGGWRVGRQGRRWTRGRPPPQQRSLCRPRPRPAWRFTSFLNRSRALAAPLPLPPRRRFVCLAVWQALGTSSFGGKFIACLGPVSAFVCIGCAPLPSPAGFRPTGGGRRPALAAHRRTPCCAGLLRASTAPPPARLPVHPLHSPAGWSTASPTCSSFPWASPAVSCRRSALLRGARRPGCTASAAAPSPVSAPPRHPSRPRRRPAALLRCPLCAARSPPRAGTPRKQARP